MYSSYANERSGLQKEKLSWLFNTQLEVSFQSHLLIPYIRVDFEEPLESIASGGVPSEDTGHESQEDVSQEPQQPAEEVEEQKQQKEPTSDPLADEEVSEESAQPTETEN